MNKSSRSRKFKQNGWGQTTLGACCSVVMGQSPSSETYNSNGDGLPFLQGKADFGEKFPDISAWCSSPIKIAEENDILFSVRAPVGATNIANRKYCIGRGLCALRPKINFQYLYFLIQFHEKGFQLLSQGSTFEAINSQELTEYPLLIPSEIEQKKIAEILSVIDREIELSDLRAKKKRQLLAACRLEVLGFGPKLKEKLRPVRLGQIFTNSRKKGSKGIVVASVTKDGIFPRDRLDRRVESDLLPEDHLLAEKDTLAYNMMRMWQGVVGYADKDYLVSPAYIVLKAKKEIHSRFFYHAFKSEPMIQKFRAYSTGITDDRLRLYFDDFSAITIKIPSRDFQTKATIQLDALEKTIASSESICRGLHYLKSGLMGDLLNGKIKVKV